MLILNCTKAAADFFSTTQKGKKISRLEPAPKQTIAESNDPAQWQWLVHTIKVKGKNVLIAMDYHTRFSITLSALKKGDDGSFMNNAVAFSVVIFGLNFTAQINVNHVVDAV